MFDHWYDNGPRTWKYAVPGGFIILLIPLTGWMMVSTDESTQALAIVPLGFCALLGAIFLVNLWKYVSAHNASLFREHQEALSVTPLVLLANSMKQMHPEAVRVLNRFGVRTSWQVRIDANRGVRDWVLADTNVHFGFIEFVLHRSGAALYPKNRFMDGSKKWDPDGLVEDREQYNDLEKWMFARLMVTRSHGEFKPAEFIPPWTPALILETMGLTGEQELYQPEDGSGAARQLPVEDVERRTSNVEGQKTEDVHALTTEEEEANQLELERYSRMYVDGKVPS